MCNGTSGGGNPGGGLVCQSIGPTNCDKCLTQSCCDQLTTCEQNPDCVAAVNCITQCELAGSSALQCVEGQCNSLASALFAGNLSDCVQGSCGSTCFSTTTCTDGIKDGTESDIDCGGAICLPCTEGRACQTTADCGSGQCSAGVCVSPTCKDGVKNGSETDVDYGGGQCFACPDGEGCMKPFDCTSGICTAGVCGAPTCTDGVRNGSETDTDCGGTCQGCGPGMSCQTSTDCVTSICNQGVCLLANQCSNGTVDGTETGVDCGGSYCPPCPAGQPCNSASDCISGSCSGGVCGANIATCTDGIRNGSETDVDCGGASCAACDFGRLCSTNADCASSFCLRTCRSPVVIAQVYMSNQGSIPSFVELHNRSGAPVSVDGWSVRTNTPDVPRILSGFIPAFSSYLVSEGGPGFPQPDVVESIPVMIGEGAVALFNQSDPPIGAICGDPTLVDRLVFGAPACSDVPPQGTASPSDSFQRQLLCVDTDTPADFVIAPVAPRNSASPPIACP